MTLQRELRNRLEQNFPRHFSVEPECTCGNPNHARTFLFRVNNLPATAIVPEGYELTPARFSDALGGARVEPMLERELDSIFPDNEIGHTEPFENPFGTAVYLDENLLQFYWMVFCPKMLSGLKGECFRLPVKDFQQLVHPVVLQLSPPSIVENGTEAW